MPAELALILETAGHDVDTVPQEGMAGRPDSDIWEATQLTGRFLITQDLDFSDIRKYEPGAHNGILLVRLSNPSRRILIERVRGLFEMEKVEEWHGCFIVATEVKTRIRRPNG